MSLHVLAYNMKRMISILGVGRLLQATRAWALISQLSSRGFVEKSELLPTTFSRGLGRVRRLDSNLGKVRFSVAASVNLRPDYLMPLPFCAPA